MSAAAGLDAATRAALARGLVEAVGPEAVLSRAEDLLVYEWDAYLVRGPADAVVFPSSAEDVARVVRVAGRFGVPVVARGAGTGLAGGAAPTLGGIVLATSRMNRILAIDPRDQTALVEPGVVNADVSRAAAPHGLFYAPDPSSYTACSIGGNVNTNSGGPHCLAYGVTSNHLLGLEIVTGDGAIEWLGGAADRPGYDLVGLLCGSEGTLAIVTKVLLRLLPLRETVRTALAAFDRLDDASQAVSAIIAAGFVPTALEMMDRVVIGAVEAAVGSGYLPDAEAVLLIETEGLREEVDRAMAAAEAICRARGAREVRVSRDEAERQILWAGRKGAFAAIGRLAHNFYLHDTCVPRTRIPEALRRIGEIADAHGLRVGSAFHAGDGNLHPMLLFDMRDPGGYERAHDAGEAMLRVCVDLGGAVSGEHGIGVEKRPYLRWAFTETELDVQRALRRAFDPAGRLNPGKKLPDPIA